MRELFETTPHSPSGDPICLRIGDVQTIKLRDDSQDCREECDQNLSCKPVGNISTAHHH